MAKAAKQKKTTPELAWHFVNSKLRDGKPISADGVWLVHEGECEMCSSGLHASRRLIDALQYAPGSTVCRVAVRDIAAEENDKLVARQRMIVWRLEASDEVLRAFARKAALSVIHLWDAPDVVRKYLETGDESLRAAAWDAAWAAARDAWDAAWAAARAAARDAAWDAAWAARAAARDAAWAAARAAARAARDAARDAKLEEFNAILEQMVTEAAGNPDTSALLKVAA